MCRDFVKMYTCGHTKVKSRLCNNLHIPHLFCVMLCPRGPPVIGGHFHHACRECTSLEMEYSLAREPRLAPLPAPVDEEASVVELVGWDDAAGCDVFGERRGVAPLEGRRALRLDKDEILVKLMPKGMRDRRSTLEGFKPAEILEMLRPEVTKDRRCTLLFLPNDEVLVKLTPESSTATTLDYPGPGGATLHTPAEKSARRAESAPAHQGMVLPSVMTNVVSRKPVPQRSAGAERGPAQQSPPKKLRRADSGVALLADKALGRSEDVVDLGKQHSLGCPDGQIVRNDAVKGTKQHPGDRQLLPSYRYASNNGVPPTAAQALGRARNSVPQRATNSQTQRPEQAPGSRAPSTSNTQARRHHSDSAVCSARNGLHGAEVPTRPATLDARALRKRDGAYFGKPKAAGNTSDYDWILELGESPGISQFSAVGPDNAGLSSPRRRGAISASCPPEPRTYTAWRVPVHPSRDVRNFDPSSMDTPELGPVREADSVRPGGARTRANCVEVPGFGGPWAAAP